MRKHVLPASPGVKTGMPEAFAAFAICIPHCVGEYGCQVFAVWWAVAYETETEILDGRWRTRARGRLVEEAGAELAQLVREHDQHAAAEGERELGVLHRGSRDRSGERARYGRLLHLAISTHF